MGKGKLKLEMIEKEKKRLTTFKIRKQGLIRKIHEFTTLCDVSACMIIYGPNQESGRSEPETWPANRDEVKRVIEIYRAKNRGLGNRAYGLHDFFMDKKRKIDDEIKEMRQKNVEAKYPTWHDFMNFLPEDELRGFAADLSAKAERVRVRVEQMKGSQLGLGKIDKGLVGGDYYNNAPDQSMKPTVDDSIMMLLMNGEYENYDDQICDFDDDCVDPILMWDEQQMPVGQYYGLDSQRMPVEQCYGPGSQLMPFGQYSGSQLIPFGQEPGTQLMT
ncbi:hypothetical protein CASFOL_042434 [Castilleja foliolosa]|uniref:MADS-box domain-containing protein n=1 Tax=Castilleja foliolosa TaxID=1961234 RepID=A0ABD3BAH4_9LAMI